jgi:hypothetical protein
VCLVYLLIKKKKSVPSLFGFMYWWKVLAGVLKLGLEKSKILHILGSESFAQVWEFGLFLLIKKFEQNLSEQTLFLVCVKAHIKGSIQVLARNIDVMRIIVLSPHGGKQSYYFCMETIS